MKEVQKPKKPLIFYYLIAIAVLLLLNVFIFPSYLESKIIDVDYGTFIQMVEDGQVAEVSRQEDLIQFVDKNDPPQYYQTYYFEDTKLADRLLAAGVTFGTVPIETMNPILYYLLSLILPVVFFIVVGQLLNRFLMKKMNSGGMPSMQFGKSNAKVYVESTTGIKFSDVAGEDEAKEILQEIVDFLHNPQKYQEIGARMPDRKSVV